MIQFTKVAAYIPDPIRSRPVITDQDRALAAYDPPYPGRIFCKPWTDAQLVGWTIFYGYLTPITVVGLGKGEFRVDNIETLRAESQLESVLISQAGGYFAFPATGYTFFTEPGYICLILPATQPPPGAELVPGVLETDWFPLEMPAVYKVPDEGKTITFDYKMELARVVPIPRLDNVNLTPMGEAEMTALMARRQQYLDEWEQTAGRAVHGTTIKQRYKKWSAEFRRRLAADEE